MLSRGITSDNSSGFTISPDIQSVMLAAIAKKKTITTI
jgi:hypothetical protein